MNKTNQFSPKAQYVTPSCRTVMLQAKESILVASGNPGARWYDGGAGTYGDDETNDNGEY